jgi:protein-tyrosine phosphatase
MNNDLCPLKLLHPESTLNAGKVAAVERSSTETITASLSPGQGNGLKTRPDGTILDANHRIHILRKRGVDVHGLPREIVAPTELVMLTKLYWIAGPWPGKLAISARPRGGDWLVDEMREWQGAGLNTVLSLLTSGEEQDFDLTAESRVAKREGLKFLSLPIPDRQVPFSPSQVAPVLDELDAELASGKNAVIHCRQGIGRSGMMAACLLAMRGKDPGSAIIELEWARGTSVPETTEQRQWIDLYASTLTHVK